MFCSSGEGCFKKLSLRNMFQKRKKKQLKSNEKKLFFLFSKGKNRQKLRNKNCFYIYVPSAVLLFLLKKKRKKFMSRNRDLNRIDTKEALLTK